MTDKTKAMENLIAQDADLLDAEGVKLYWYCQGKDDGADAECAKIVAWLEEQINSAHAVADTKAAYWFRRVKWGVENRDWRT